MDDELYHYGVKGMKWGVRRTPAQLGHKTATKKKTSLASRFKGAVSSKKKTTTKKTVETAQKPKKKKVTEMTDEELKAKIARLDMEKRYQDLVKATTPQKSTKGRDFVGRVLEKSGENIATQLTTYALGSAVNQIAKSFGIDDNIVNPKKGQKDK